MICAIRLDETGDHEVALDKAQETLLRAFRPAALQVRPTHNTNIDFRELDDDDDPADAFDGEAMIKEVKRLGGEVKAL